MTPNFSFNRRNTGHWDVWDNDKKCRIFRIRGGGPESWDSEHVKVVGEHHMEKHYGEWIRFNTISAATTFIMDALMYEEKVWPK